MSKTMLVALWLRDTSVHHQGADAASRLTELRKALAAAEAWRSKHAPVRRWAEPPMIFVAPEYLFSEPTGFTQAKLDRRLSFTQLPGPDPITSQRRHMDEADAKALIRDLRGISAKYAHLLIVPGTIAWSKKFTELVKKDPDIGNKLLKRIVALHRRVGGEAPTNEPMSGVHDSIFKGVAPRPAATVDQKVEALQAMSELAVKGVKKPLDAAEAQKLDAARLCKNTALVLYGGKTVFVYSKQGDFHEVMSSQDASHAYEVAIPGQKDGFFEIDGVHYGIEICFDHAIGTLQHPIQSGAKGRAPFIEIVTSASVGIEVDHPNVQPHGYVLNAACDQGPYDDNVSGVWMHARSDGLLHRLAPAEMQKDVAGYPLWLYEILLP